MKTGNAFARLFAGLTVLAVLAGCGGSSAPPAISVSVSPATATVVAAGSATFTATVTNDSANAGVTWSATAGTISATGVYTAPSAVTTATATITATSKTDPTKTATATVTLTAVSVSVAPPTVTLIGGASQTFTATVSNDGASAGVTWTASAGTITAAGVYTAPAVVTTTSATVTATSKTDPSKSATATVTLTPISVSVAPPTVTLIGAATQTFTATVTADGANAGVTWTASTGSITAGGVYTAPAVVTTLSATITATSKTDPTKSGTATVTLTPISVSVAPLTVTLIGGATQTFTPTVTADGANAGVTWTASTGSITAGGVYTAPAVVTTLSATITATSKTDPTKSGTATVTLTPISVNAISPATVSLNGGGSQPFTDTVSADGSNSGVTWSIGTGVGTLSAVTSTSVTYTAPAVISGTTPITVSLIATSIKDPTKSSTAAVITLNPISLTLTPSSPASMIGGATQPFSATVSNDGSNSGVTWSVTSGGGSFTPTTTASGVNTTYTSASPVTTASAVVTATSVKDPTKSVSATISLTPIGISFTTSTTGIILDSGQTLALAAAVTNDSSASGATFSATGAGSVLPTSASGNAPATTLTATGAVTSTVTVTAASTKDPTKTATTSSITVNPALALAGGALTPGATNTVYAGATITATGGTGARTYTLASGSLPTGLTLSSAGVISGGPITSGATTYTFGIKVTDSATTPASTTTNYSITVSATPLVVTSPTISPASYTVGTPITPIALTASGGTGAVNFSLGSGALPAGLGITGSSATGYFLSGTPTAPTVVAGNTVTFRATDSATVPVTANSNPITLVVNPVTLVITSAFLPPGVVGSPYNGAGYQLASTGGTGTITWSMTPTTVDGLTVSPSGLLAGTPTAPLNTNLSITAMDSATNQQQTKTVSLPIGITNALTVTTLNSSLPYAYTNAPYSGTLSAAGGSGTGYTWTVTSGSASLAALNLSISPAGAITGTPTSTGTANFTVQVKDSANNTATGTFSITAYTPLSLPSPNPSSLPGATINTAYTGSIVANGGVPGYTFTVNGTVIPTNGTPVLIADGISVSNNGGPLLSVTGTPPATQTVSLTTSVKDGSGSTVGPFPYTVLVSNVLSVTTTTANLTYAYTNQPYNFTLVAAGGTGTGYTWTVTSGGPSLTALNLSLSSAGVISGTPTSIGQANFTVQVKDSANNTATASLTLNAYAPLALPTPNPGSLPSAILNQAYNGTIGASGGVGPYTFTVNGNAVPTGLGDNLTASSTGSVLSVTGTPGVATTVSFTVSVKDSTNTSVGPFTYTVAVSQNYSISGQVYSNACGQNGLNGISVTINTSTPQTVTTSGNGNYTFTNVPPGNYTITPSLAGASAIFYPATQSVTVTTNNLTNWNFNANLGFNVSGTVAYAGSKTGKIFLSLGSTTCGGGGSAGTSLSAPGTFTVHGVAPGTYTLTALLDTLGIAQPNTADPSGTATVTVSNANVTGVTVALTDPGTTTLPSGPTLNGVAPFNTGAIASFKAITNSSGTEMATSYTLQWSTTSNFATVAGSKVFPANGTHSNVWFLNGLTNGSIYYFRAFGTSAGTSVSPYSATFGPVTIGAGTAANTVSGSVTFPGTPTGPLYTGFYDQTTGIFYGQVFTNPSSPQAYTVQVPSGSNYLFVGILDQNNNGIIDAGDITDVNNSNNSAATVITGSTTGLNLTLSNAAAIGQVTTQHWKSTFNGNTSQTYYVNLGVGGNTKLPVAVQLVSGPNVVSPLDIALCGVTSNGCGQGFQFTENLFTTSPTVGDTYTFNVTYSDGTTGNITAAVATVLSSFATNLAPVTGTSTSTTPTFSWTDPANAANYTYQFYMNDNNGNTIWQIPGQNSKGNGFSSSITSIPWSTTVDPTGANNPPSVTSLSTAVQYSWNITVQDANGNSAITSVQYQP